MEFFIILNPGKMIKKSKTYLAEFIDFAYI